MKTMAMAAAIFLSWASSAYGGLIVQWRTEDGGNGHYYELVGNYLDPDQRWSWQDSKVMAENLTHLGMQGHLATIASREEDDFLVNTFILANPLPTWIGLTDDELYGGQESFGQSNPQVDGWVWVTGEPITFTDWVTGAPDGSFNREEDYALIGSQHLDHHKWNDEQGNTGAHAQFFVEYEPAIAPIPEPATAAIWLGIVATLGFGRTRFNRVVRRA